MRSFHEWSEDKAARFSEDAIEESIRYLEDTALISRDICGNYELVGNVW